MVANLSSHKPGWDERWEEFSDWAEKGKTCHDRLLALVDEDTQAFNRIMDAFGLPKGTEEEQAVRDEAIQTATRGAIEVPLRVMQTALESMEIIAAMAADGLPASISDAGVGALCARSAVLGAGLNVAINAKELTDKNAAEGFCAQASELEQRAAATEAQILELVRQKL
jgi:glutamate formiminotransferase/formiminotetrahydrofolate cyclodeaminase